MQHPSNYNHPVTGTALCRFGHCRCRDRDCEKIRLDEAARSIARNKVHRADAANLWDVPQGLAVERANEFRMKESSLPSYMLHDERLPLISDDSDSDSLGSSWSGSSRSGSEKSRKRKSGSKSRRNSSSGNRDRRK